MNKKQEIKMFLNATREELSRYNKTKNTTYLREAGNKLYNSYLLFIEFIYQIEIMSAREASPYADELEDKYEEFKKIRFNVLSLHKWFYEGIDDEMYAYKLTKNTIKQFNKLLRKT